MRCCFCCCSLYVFVIRCWFWVLACRRGSVFGVLGAGEAVGVAAAVVLVVIVVVVVAIAIFDGGSRDHPAYGPELSYITAHSGVPCRLSLDADPPTSPASGPPSATSTAGTVNGTKPCFSTLHVFATAVHMQEAWEERQIQS